MKNSKLPFAKSMRMLRDQSGSALMIALFTVTLLLVVAMEIVYESNIDFLVSSQEVNQVKAYYAAKAGAELSLLRVHIYKKALAAFGEQIPDKSILEMIWNTPFAWPPPIPEDLNAVDKDSLQGSIKASMMKSAYTVTILSEGGKIDLNDLASPSQALRDSTKKLLIQVFTSRAEADDAWSREFRNFNFEELVNNLADWVDDNSESLNGGAENRFYRDAPPGVDMPPNRVFQSVKELHLVAGMVDPLYEILEPRVTVYGIKAINLNHANKQVLMSLDSSITSEIADKIIESRNDPNRGPFKDLKDFLGFVEPLGVPGGAFIDREEKPIIPLAFDPEYNFRVEAIGQSGKVTKKITAIVYDFDRAKTSLSEQLKKEKKPETPPTDPNDPNKPPADPNNPPADPNKKDQSKPQIKPPTDRPNVVYWLEE